MGWGPQAELSPGFQGWRVSTAAVSGETASPSLFPLVLNNPMLFLGLDGICQHHESLIFADWSPQGGHGRVLWVLLEMQL